MKLSSDISNAKGRYPYKYKQVAISRLDGWQIDAAQLEAKLEAVECGECGKTLLECDYVECDKKASE